jgi:hypothetical protein
MAEINEPKITPEAPFNPEHLPSPVKPEITPSDTERSADLSPAPASVETEEFEGTAPAPVSTPEIAIPAAEPNPQLVAAEATHEKIEEKLMNGLDRNSEGQAQRLVEELLKGDLVDPNKFPG